MNTLYWTGFKPNSNKKVIQIIDINAENPFTNLSESRSGHIYDMTASLLSMRLENCDKHEVFMLLNHIDVFQNVWRILEVLHYLIPKKYGKLPLSWYYMIDYLGSKDFHKEIKNIETGQRKIYNFCFIALENLLDFMVDAIDGKFKYTDLKATWQDISLKLIRIVNLLTIERKCDCHQPIVYNDLILDQVKRNYPYIIRNQINTWINDVFIEWDNLAYDYNESTVKTNYLNKLKLLFNNPPEKAFKRQAKLMTLPYDLLKESTRLHYIKGRIGDSRYQSTYNDNGEHTQDRMMLGLNEALPTLFYVNAETNQCFVCDQKIYNNYNSVRIINGVIHEALQHGNSFIYPLIHRCESCKLGKYRDLITSNQTCIMARHYKWMTFWTGFFDVKSLLSIIPLDVAKTIVILYEKIR